MLAVGPLGLGPLELGIILAVVLMLFGAARLPEAASALGRSIREFRKATRQDDDRQADGRA